MRDKMESEILPLEEHIGLLLNGEAHALPCDEKEEESEFPKWFDPEKYKRAQIYMRNNIFVQFMCMLNGLIAVLAIPSILNILVKTHRSSSVLTSYRRYLSTMHHTYSWIMDDLKPGSKSWKSLTAVRGRHLRAARNSKMRGNEHISQRDMVLTQFGFCGFYFLRYKSMGVDDSDFVDYIHFWRTIGYMLGIEDRFNLCRPSVEESRELCEIICKEVYQPLLTNPPEYFNHYVSTMLEGLWYVNPTSTKGAQMYILYAMAGIPGFSLQGLGSTAKVTESENRQKFNMNNNITVKNDLKACDNNNKKLNHDDYITRLTGYDKFLINFLTYWKTYLMQFWLGRIYLNGQIALIMFLTDKFPFLCFYRFGWKKSFINIFEEGSVEPAQLKTNKEVPEIF